MKKKLRCLYYVLKILAIMIMSIISLIAVFSISYMVYKILLAILGIFYSVWMCKTIYKFGGDLCRKDGIFGPESSKD